MRRLIPLIILSLLPSCRTQRQEVLNSANCDSIDIRQRSLSFIQHDSISHRTLVSFDTLLINTTLAGTSIRGINARAIVDSDISKSIESRTNTTDSVATSAETIYRESHSKPQQSRRQFVVGIILGFVVALVLKKLIFSLKK